METEVQKQIKCRQGDCRRSPNLAPQRPDAEERMSLLVIGPSGVGKSSALQFAARSLAESRFRCLDGLARDLGRERGVIGENEGVNALRQQLRDDDEFLRLGRDAVERLEPLDGGLLIVDVGAGFLDATSVSKWLREQVSV